MHSRFLKLTLIVQFRKQLYLISLTAWPAVKYCTIWCLKYSTQLPFDFQNVCEQIVALKRSGWRETIIRKVMGKVKAFFPLPLWSFKRVFKNWWRLFAHSYSFWNIDMLLWKRPKMNSVLMQEKNSIHTRHLFCTRIGSVLCCFSNSLTWVNTIIWCYKTQNTTVLLPQNSSSYLCCVLALCINCGNDLPHKILEVPQTLIQCVRILEQVILQMA